VQTNILRTPLDDVLEYPLEEHRDSPDFEEFTQRFDAATHQDFPRFDSQYAKEDFNLDSYSSPSGPEILPEIDNGSDHLNMAVSLIILLSSRFGLIRFFFGRMRSPDYRTLLKSLKIATNLVFSTLTRIKRFQSN